MRSKFFKKLELADVDWEIMPRIDEYGLPRLRFISGKEERSLDLSAVRKVSQVMREHGEEKNAETLDELIDAARQLSLRSIRS